MVRVEGSGFRVWVLGLGFRVWAVEGFDFELLRPSGSGIQRVENVEDHREFGILNPNPYKP